MKYSNLVARNGHARSDPAKKSLVVFRGGENVIAVYCKNSFRYAFDSRKEKVVLVKTDYDDYGIWIRKKDCPTGVGIVWLT